MSAITFTAGDSELGETFTGTSKEIMQQLERRAEEILNEAAETLCDLEAQVRSGEEQAAGRLYWSVELAAE